jgi:hypothetical protein
VKKIEEVRIIREEQPRKGERKRERERELPNSLAPILKTTNLLSLSLSSLVSRSRVLAFAFARASKFCRNKIREDGSLARASRHPKGGERDVLSSSFFFAVLAQFTHEETNKKKIFRVSRFNAGKIYKLTPSFAFVFCSDP